MIHLQRRVLHVSQDKFGSLRPQDALPVFVKTVLLELQTLIQTRPPRVKIARLAHTGHHAELSASVALLPTSSTLILIRQPLAMTQTSAGKSVSLDSGITIATRLLRVLLVRLADMHQVQAW